MVVKNSISFLVLLLSYFVCCNKWIINRYKGGFYCTEKNWPTAACSWPCFPQCFQITRWAAHMHKCACVCVHRLCKYSTYHMHKAVPLKQRWSVLILGDCKNACNLNRNQKLTGWSKLEWVVNIMHLMEDSAHYRAAFLTGCARLLLTSFHRFRVLLRYCKETK